MRNLSRRVERIEKLGLDNVRYAAQQFRELQASTPKNLNKLSDKELRTLYRDLRYIDRLKTSTVKGAKQAQAKFEPIREKLEPLSQPLKDKFWEIYGKVYEELGGTAERFKYEVFDVTTDYIYDGADTDKAVLDIVEQYRTALKELGSNATDEEVKLLFTNQLKTLRK